MCKLHRVGSTSQRQSENRINLCNLNILKNRIDIFSVETNICQFSNMASSGLKKRFILQYYIHKNMYQKMFSKITFFFFIMADVMSYVRLMLCLG